MNKKQLIFALVTLLLFSTCHLYAFDPNDYPCFYTYNKTIVEGSACVTKPVASDNICFMFIIKNNTKTAIDLEKVIYRVEKRDGSIYRLEKPKIFENEGIGGSYTLNPNQEAWVSCESPFKNFLELKEIKEVYIKDQGGRRIFFVPQERIKEYATPYNLMMRHLRNLYWNLK